MLVLALMRHANKTAASSKGFLPLAAGAASANPRKYEAGP